MLINPRLELVASLTKSGCHDIRDLEKLSLIMDLSLRKTLFLYSRIGQSSRKLRPSKIHNPIVQSNASIKFSITCSPPRTYVNKPLTTSTPLVQFWPQSHGQYVPHKTQPLMPHQRNWFLAETCYSTSPHLSIGTPSLIADNIWPTKPTYAKIAIRSTLIIKSGNRFMSLKMASSAN